MIKFRTIWLLQALCYTALFIPSHLSSIVRDPLAAPPAPDPMFNRWPASVTYVIVLMVLYAVYHYTLKRVVCDQMAPQEVVWGTTTLIAACCWLRPFLSSDLYRYLMEGRILGVYHQNPYLHSIFEFSFPVSWYAFSPSFAETPSTYGPVELLLQAGIAFLVQNNFWLGVFLFKGLCGGLHLLNGWLLYRILQRIRPETRLTDVLFYLWSPLVCIEGIINAHNDLIATTFLLLLIYAWLTKRQSLVSILAVLMILTKISFVVFLPACMVLFWKQGNRRQLVLSSGYGFLIGLTAYLFFFTNPNSFKGLAMHATILAKSLPLWIVYFIREIVYGTGPSPKWTADRTIVISITGKAVLLFCLGCILWRSRRVTDTLSWLQEMTIAGLVYVFIGVNWFQAWYIIPIISLATCTSSQFLRTLVWWFSFTSLLVYTVDLWLEYAYRDTVIWIHALEYTIIFGLPSSLTLKQFLIPSPKRALSLESSPG